MKSICAIDVSGESLDAFDSRTGKSKRFENTSKGFSRLMNWAKGVERFVMEATGSHHMAIADHLHSQDAAVVVVNPARAKHYAGSMGIRNKTDQVDAEVLARFALVNELPLYSPLPDWQKELRALVRHRRHLVSERASLKTRQKEPGLDEFVLRQLSQIEEFLDQQLKQTEKRMREVVAAPELKYKVDLLRTIPGVGVVLAFELLAEFGGFDTFSSAKAAAAYAGVCPAERQSGAKRWVSRMSKAGNAQLRMALYMPALAAVRCEGPFKTLYMRLLEKGKSKLSALGAVMHKLVRVAYGVAKSGLPFTHEGVAKP
jgi:transposase